MGNSFTSLKDSDLSRCIENQYDRNTMKCNLRAVPLLGRSNTPNYRQARFFFLALVMFFSLKLLFLCGFH